jgi:hypothetical protein
LLRHDHSDHHADVHRMTKPCDLCPIGSMCARHNIVKHAHLRMLCETREDYRALWDKQAAQSTAAPSLARRIANFSKAAIGHAVRGLPTADQATIDARLEICKACPRFDGSICRHAKCGCGISRERAFLNKLAWADQSCPLGKWPAVAAPRDLDQLD